MRKVILSFGRVGEADRAEVGGKGFTLASMCQKGFPVPPGVCLGASLYKRYVASTGLEELIHQVLGRKNFEEMRWEEIWDASLRIRNLFLRTEIAADLLKELRQELSPFFGDKSVVVRSSSPAEDTARASFAGLHESYVNVRGIEKIIDHIRLVWASLWSDAALLYRKELGLDPASSAMAVVVQELIEGQRSGVAFGRSPTGEDSAVIEAVWGLNEGLVSGEVEPDRWFISRDTGRIIKHVAAERQKKSVSGSEGTGLEAVDSHEAGNPSLDEKRLTQVYSLLGKVESYLGQPPDMEWTFKNDRLYLLQARPITTSRPEKSPGRRLWESEDKRPWYLTLTRSLENLSALRKRITEELIPQMESEALNLAGQRLDELSDAGIADEISRRIGIRDRWNDVYWSEFIPFAHGIRIFGQIYNNSVRPEDPYEFVDLLAVKDMKSVQRNRALEDLAAAVRSRPLAVDELRAGNYAVLGGEVLAQLDAFIKKHGDISCGASLCMTGREGLINLLVEMAAAPPREKAGKGKDIHTLEKEFLGRFEGGKRERAEKALEIGRESYRLRDDDNLYLGKIEGELLRALDEGKARIARRGADAAGGLAEREVRLLLRDRRRMPQARSEKKDKKSRIEARQLVGQPASAGIAMGRARVIDSTAGLFQMKSGEVLVVDAIEPNMTFIVPLAAGIVERRGGMLIHGAIIAREYGIPCVTGIPGATERIATGDEVTVDGYLGIVRIKKKSTFELNTP